MKRLIRILAGVVCASLLCAIAHAADAPKKLLAVTITLGYRHSSIPLSEKILKQLGEQSGAFTVDFISQPPGKPDMPRKPEPLKADATAEQQAAFKETEARILKAQTENEKWLQSVKVALEKMSPASLKNYDGVIFISTTGNLPIPDKQGFLDWLKSGKAFIGIHAATDTFHGWPEFIEMLGGEFSTHGPQVGVECLNKDESHPATAHLGQSWTITQEEIYQFKNYDSSKVHDLLVMDKHPNNKTPGHFPVSWTREYGKGRVSHTSIGHREDIWDADPAIEDRKNSTEISKAFQAHLVGGIKWALEKQ